MKVLLTRDVQGLGRAGDVKEVSDGHARNFLIPKHFGIPATSSVLATVQKEEKERQDKFTRQQETLLSLKTKLEGKTFTVRGRAEKQHLFAALRPNDIASSINEKFHTQVEPNQIVLDKPVKSLGLQEIELKLSDNLQFKIKLDVQPL